MRGGGGEGGGEGTWQTATALEEESDILPNWSWVLLPPPMLLSLSTHATAQGRAVSFVKSVLRRTNMR